MVRRWWFALALLVCVLGCERPAEEPPATPLATLAPPTTASPDPQALERTPGSTPPLADVVAPATVPRPGLAGPPNSSPAAGRLDAPVRVYVVTDSQCPVCRRALEPLKRLVRTYPDDVLVVVKHAASPRHPLAADAAAASLAAFRERKFWTYQDQMFEDQSRLARPDLLGLARTTGLNVTAFGRDLDDEAVVAQVEYETALAQELDLAATPSFVINGHVQRGWGSYRGLQSIVERELTRARTIAAEGVPPARVAYEATRRSGPDGERFASALFEPAN
jgi:protein-disulfide isomerase